MSGSYYRVTPEPEKVEGYGFKKVCQSELSSIIDRITKPTYSSLVQKDESEKIHNYRRIRSAIPPRTPSSCHRRRVSVGPRSARFDNDRKLSELDLQRLVRRVQKPTSAVSYRYYQPSQNGQDANSQDLISRSRRLSTSERKKAFDQLARPTTATRAKNVKECHLCDADDVENNTNLDIPFDYPYADDQSATKEEVASIISRVSSPTKASERGIRPCWKTPPNLEKFHHLSESLPLVSGLDRSKSVSQIVQRLHSTRGNYRRIYHGHSVQATPTTNFDEM